MTSHIYDLIIIGSGRPGLQQLYMPRELVWTLW